MADGDLLGGAGRYQPKPIEQCRTGLNKIINREQIDLLAQWGRHKLHRCLQGCGGGGDGQRGSTRGSTA